MNDKMLKKLEERNKEAVELGVPPLNPARFVPGCTWEELCSPYISQSWGHDRRCPLGCKE